MYRNTVQIEKESSIQVIGRAIAVLKTCDALGPGLSLGDISRKLGLPRSTVQRIVQALAEGGFLISGNRAKSIALGPDLLAMGADATGNVVELVQPILKALAEQTEETVDLARFNRDHMVFMNQIPGAHRLQAVSAVGDIFPMHCTANGKAALAQLADGSLPKVLGNALKIYTNNTITDYNVLLSEINNIRETTLAVDNEEHTLGICAIGMAFKDPARQIYAISIPIPAVRFEIMRARCEPLLIAAIHEVNKKLGSHL